MKSPKTKGFTLVEILVVLAIMVVMATVSIVGFRDYYFYQSYNQAVVNLKTTLVDARVRARSSEGNQARGVKFFTNSIVVFPGTVYSAGNPENRTVSLSGVTLNTALYGGTDTIIFNNLTGLPTATGTVDIVGIQHSDTETIEITESGVIQ